MLASSSVSDAEGRFAVPASTLGTYSWKALEGGSGSGSGACADSVTKLPLAHNWELTAPHYPRLVVTDLALLTNPASAKLPPANQGSPAVFERVYRAFGIDAQKLKVRTYTHTHTHDT